VVPTTILLSAFSSLLPSDSAHGPAYLQLALGWVQPNHAPVLLHLSTPIHNALNSILKNALSSIADVQQPVLEQPVDAHAVDDYTIDTESWEKSERKLVKSDSLTWSR